MARSALQRGPACREYSDHGSAQKGLVWWGSGALEPPATVLHQLSKKYFAATPRRQDSCVSCVLGLCQSVSDAQSGLVRELLTASHAPTPRVHQPAHAAEQRRRQAVELADEAQPHARNGQLRHLSRQHALHQRQQGRHLSGRSPPILRAEGVHLAPRGGWVHWCTGEMSTSRMWRAGASARTCCQWLELHQAVWESGWPAAHARAG